MIVQFTPPIPLNSTDDSYIDTSILRILAFELDNTLGKAILNEIEKLKGKRTTSFHVKYEINRSLLEPLWTLYMLTYEKKDISLAVNAMNQSYSSRLPKTLNSIVVKLAANPLPNHVQSWESFCASIRAFATDLQRNVDRVIQRFESNITGCELHKPIFDISANFPDAIKCKTNCTVETLWKNKRKELAKISNLILPANTNSKIKAWIKENSATFKDASENSVFGKNERNCMKLSDAIILFNSKKTGMRVLTTDNSFVAMALASNHKVHQMDSISKILGGSVKTQAQDAFKKKSSSESK